MYQKEIPLSLAQQRRSQENFEFSQLSKELPLAKEITTKHIDKTAMVRLALSYIKLHSTLPKPMPSCYPDFDSFWTSNSLDLMDSFLMVLDGKMDVLYVSETISIYLGLSQVEVTGISLFDYLHPEDIARFHSCLTNSQWGFSCNIRMKSSLTKRANKDSIRSSPGFKVIRLDVVPSVSSWLVHCIPLPSLILSTLTISRHSFVIQTTLDLRIINYDQRSEELFTNFYAIGDELKGTSFYSLIHPEDTEIVRKMHCQVFTLFAYRTPYFRMILRRSCESFHVESSVYRYSLLSAKCRQDTITIISNIL